MINIYTSYFSKIKHIRENSARPCIINIARYTRPEIDKYINYSIRGFMPSRELLLNYKNGLVSEQQYKQTYTTETLNNFDDIGNINIYTICPKVEWFDSVFLLCYEKSDSFCHRHILRDDILNSMYKLNVTELEV